VRDISGIGDSRRLFLTKPVKKKKKKMGLVSCHLLIDEGDEGGGVESGNREEILIGRWSRGKSAEG